MSPAELRLECLKLVHGFDSCDSIEDLERFAERLYEFCIAKDEEMMARAHDLIRMMENEARDMN